MPNRATCQVTETVMVAPLAILRHWHTRTNQQRNFAPLLTFHQKKETLPEPSPAGPQIFPCGNRTFRLSDTLAARLKRPKAKPSSCCRGSRLAHVTC
jgi:hypothetical protein